MESSGSAAGAGPASARPGNKAAEARDAASGLSGLALGGDQSSSSGRSTPTDLPHNKLFVGGLSWQTSADKLREYFGQYGTIIDVQVLKDPLTQVRERAIIFHFQRSNALPRSLSVCFPFHSTCVDVRFFSL